MRIMHSEQDPLHPVESDCSRVAPSLIRSLRLITVMLSRPRKPPSNTLLPSLSTLFTHHAKFINSLWKHRSRNVRSPTPSRSLRMWYTRRHAHPCTGGLTSENSHS